MGQFQGGKKLFRNTTLQLNAAFIEAHHLICSETLQPIFLSVTSILILCFLRPIKGV
jgi:hypothetical protein